jgi:hypothetical protein
MALKSMYLRVCKQLESLQWGPPILQRPKVSDAFVTQYLCDTIITILQHHPRTVHWDKKKAKKNKKTKGAYLSPCGLEVSERPLRAIFQQNFRRAVLRVLEWGNIRNESVRAVIQKRIIISHALVRGVDLKILFVWDYRVSHMSIFECSRECRGIAQRVTDMVFESNSNGVREQQ